MDAVVQIAKASQLGFKENPLSGLLRLPEECARIADIGLDPFAAAFQPCVNLFHSDRDCAIYASDRQVFPGKKVGEMCAQLFRIEQFAGQHGLFLILVGIERRNALPG